MGNVGYKELRGLDNERPMDTAQCNRDIGTVQRRARLGGMLNYYQRRAA